MPTDLQAILTQISGAANSTTTTTKTSPKSNGVVEALTERLTKQGKGISTSSSSNLQNSINEAIASTQKSGDLSSEALQIERNREVSFARDRAGETYTTALEGRTGYATQVQGLKSLTETTEKSIRDLDQRYQQAILSNDSATAQRVADLKFKKEEFLMQQEQNFYQNLMSVATLQESITSREQQNTQFYEGQTNEDRRMMQKFGFDFVTLEKQNKQAERQMMLGLAADYGIPVTDGESIDSMIKKVSPFVSQKKALELQALRADISRSQAETQRALRGEVGAGTMSPETADALALAYINGNKDLITGLKTPEQGGQVLKRVSELTNKADQALRQAGQKVDSLEEFERFAREADIVATPEQIKLYSDLYANDWADKAYKTSQSGTKSKQELDNYFKGYTSQGRGY